MSLKPNKIERIEFPDFDEIKDQCIRKITKNYPKYGNSWKDGDFTSDWWKKRLEEEIEEIFKSKSVEEYVSEIKDAINILAMMFSNAVQKCSICNKSVVYWHSSDRKVVCKECYFE